MLTVKTEIDLRVWMLPLGHEACLRFCGETDAGNASDTDWRGATNMGEEDAAAAARGETSQNKAGEAT